MKLSDKANDRLWDGLLTELLAEDCLRELGELRSDEEIHGFSESFEKKISGIKRSVGRKEALRNLAKAVKTGAVTAASILGICFVMLLTQPKIYAAVSDVIREVFSDYDKFSYQGEFDGEIDDSKRLGYVPEGYKLRNIDYVADVLMSLSYRNEVNETISFEYGIASKCTLSVYKNGREFKEKEIDGRTYYLYMSSDCAGMWSYIVWYDGDYAFSVSGQLGEDEIVKIAENVVG